MDGVGCEKQPNCVEVAAPEDGIGHACMGKGWVDGHQPQHRIASTSQHATNVDDAETYPNTGQTALDVLRPRGLASCSSLL